VTASGGRGKRGDDTLNTWGQEGEKRSPSDVPLPLAAARTTWRRRAGAAEAAFAERGAEVRGATRARAAESTAGVEAMADIVIVLFE